MKMRGFLFRGSNYVLESASRGRYTPAMRYAFYTAVLLLGFSRAIGCSETNGTEDFYARHPQYSDRPEYFDKTNDYDTQAPNDRYTTPDPNK